VVLRKDPDSYYRVPEWDQYTWLEHGFGTRAALWPPDDRCATIKQVHTADVLVAHGPGILGSGDALVSNQPGTFLNVRTADCVPVLLVDPVRHAVGAIHAGWRGTAGNIAGAAVERMGVEFGSAPEHLRAAIGPSIGPCCYEVGPEVAVRFAAIFPERTDLAGKARIDLPEANRRQLLVAGLRLEHISVSGLCTFCLPHEFHSFRRDSQAAGRLVSTVALRVAQ
jgi:YfiH family protein